MSRSIEIDLRLPIDECLRTSHNWLERYKMNKSKNYYDFLVPICKSCKDHVESYLNRIKSFQNRGKSVEILLNHI